MKVLIRADASVEIGSGHVKRCLALGNELKARGHRVTFACRQAPGNLVDQISSQGFETLLINSNESAELIEKLKSEVQWLVVDHYALDKKWESEMRQKAKSIMVIDDLANRFHDCDLLLDQNDYEEKDKRYSPWVSPNCKKLLGPHFALLRPEFEEIRSKGLRPRKAIKNIFVSYGGVDATNETAKAIQALAPLTKQLENIFVVVGPSNPHAQGIESALKEKPRFKLYKNPQAMAELMFHSDLALGGGGTMTWERCAAGLPALVTILAENQREMSVFGDKKGYQRVIGDCQNVTVDDISKNVEMLFSLPESVTNMSRTAFETVDGKGVHRILEHLKL